jgi:hypothetical protein
MWWNEWMLTIRRIWGGGISSTCLQSTSYILGREGLLNWVLWIVSEYVWTDFSWFSAQSRFEMWNSCSKPSTLRRWFSRSISSGPVLWSMESVTELLKHFLHTVSKFLSVSFNPLGYVYVTSPAACMIDCSVWYKESAWYEDTLMDDLHTVGYIIKSGTTNFFWE